MVFKEYPQKSQIWKSETSPNQGTWFGNSLVGTCVTLPNLGFLWVFFKYPKISKNGNLLNFPVIVACSNQAGSINLFSSSRTQTVDAKVLFGVACDCVLDCFKLKNL